MEESTGLRGPPTGEGGLQITRFSKFPKRWQRTALGLSRTRGTSLESVQGKLTGNLAPGLARLLCLLVTATEHKPRAFPHLVKGRHFLSAFSSG